MFVFIFGMLAGAGVTHDELVHHLQSIRPKTIIASRQKPQNIMIYFFI